MHSRTSAERSRATRSVGRALACVVTTGVSAVLLVAARVTSDLLISLFALVGLAATTGSALWTVTDPGRSAARMVTGGVLCAAGWATLLVLAERPAAVLVPIASLVLAGAALRSPWPLGAAMVLGAVSLAVFA